MAQRGRPRKLQPEHRSALAAIVEANPTATLKEIQGELSRRTGVQAHAQTILAALREAGIVRSRDGSAVPVEMSAKTTPRYGYTEAHRRLESEQTYPVA